MKKFLAAFLILALCWFASSQVEVKAQSGCQTSVITYTMPDGSVWEEDVTSCPYVELDATLELQGTEYGTVYYSVILFGYGDYVYYALSTEIAALAPFAGLITVVALYYTILYIVVTDDTTHQISGPLCTPENCDCTCMGG